jgi:hypothetical protein
MKQMVIVWITYITVRIATTKNVNIGKNTITNKGREIMQKETFGEFIATLALFAPFFVMVLIGLQRGY